MAKKALASAAPVRAAKEGKTLLAAPEGVTGASAGGVEYPVDDDGFVDVAPEHVPALLEHGFTPREA